MKRQSQIALLFAVFAFAMSAALCQAQVRGNGLISRSMARSLGLERSWFAQIDLDPSRDRVEAVVIYQPGSLQDSVAHDDVGLAEGAQGVEQGVVSVDDTTEVVQGEAAATPTEDAALNRATVYVLTRQSVLHSVDAETGRTNWVRVVGNPKRPVEAPVANRQYVAMVNGSDLFVMDRGTGETLWQVRLHSAPVAPLAIGAKWVYVPGADGAMTAFNIDNPEEKWGYASGAPVEFSPVVTNETVSWQTRYGRLFIADKVSTRVTRRFDGTDVAATRPVYWPPYIYVATRNGYVSAVHERNGLAIWRFASGSTIYEPPVAVEDSLFVVTSQGGLFSLNSAGAQNWYRAGITQFVAASPGRVYGIDSINQLVALDRTTGLPVGAISLVDQQIRLCNQVNDRIYVCTEKGLLHCLHEIGQEEPAIHMPPAPESADGVDDAAAGNAGVDG